MIVSIIYTLALVSQLISAMPYDQVVRTLSSDVTHLAHDEVNGRYLAFKRDGSLYGTYSAEIQDVQSKRGEVNCISLSIDQAKLLPGWPQIDKYASDNWGTGSHETVTNPPDFRDQSASACLSDEVSQITLSGNPSCEASTDSTSGELVGTSGIVVLSVKEGYNVSADWSVTQGSSLQVGSTVTTSFGIPGVAEVSTSVTVTTSFTNSDGTRFSTATSNANTNNLTLNALPGESCTASFNSTSCNVQGSGRVRFLGAGWVWYNYDDETDGHYKWAVSIENVLPNIDDRSSFMEYKGNLQATSTSNYQGECK